MSKIEMGKQYVDDDNQSVRVLCVDRPVPGWPVVIMKASGNLCVLTEDGTNPVARVSIKEYDPLEEVKKLPIDAPIWVRVNDREKWLPRHFACVENGRVYAFQHGTTSFTTKDRGFNSPTSWACWSINKP